MTSSLYAVSAEFFVPQCYPTLFHSYGVATDSLSGRSYEVRLRFQDIPVGLRPSIPIELPVVPDLPDIVQIQVGHQDLVLGPAGGRDNLAPGIGKVAGAVKVAGIPRLPSNSVDDADIILV